MPSRSPLHRLVVAPLFVLAAACGDGGGSTDAGADAPTDAPETVDTIDAVEVTTTDTAVAPDVAETVEDTTPADTADAEPPSDTGAPDGTELDTTEPEPEVVEPDTTEPEDVAPDGTELDTTEPEPEVVDPDTTEPEPEVIDPDTSDPDTVEPDTSEPEVVEPPDPCDQEPPTPLAFDSLEGFTGSEDFAFREQWAYSVDMNGNLVRDAANGAGQMVLPNLSTFAAGMALLPDGRLAVNDAEQGALVLVSIASTPVTKVTLLGGLSYPNGIDVDDDGFLYVAEQDAGRVRRVDPATGAFTIIADELFNPNGVSFGPGYRRLYVGSFGGGVVYALDRREDGTWTEPVVWLALPGFGATGPPIDSCKGGQPGDLCYTNDGLGGYCSNQSVGGIFTCVPDPGGVDPLVEICARSGVGDRCSLKIAGVRYTGACVEDPFSVDLVCEIEQGIAQPCFHGYPGKTCVSFEFGQPFFGVCTDADDIPDGWGYPSQGLFCIPPGSGEGGGLDGLNVDACGTVYVTEYILGRVWRKREGGPVEIATTLPSQWIPNMHWGNGVGGWASNTLYVADRDLGRMFAIHIGRQGKHTVPSP